MSARISPINLLVLAHVLDVEGYDSGAVWQRMGMAPLTDADQNGEWLPVEVFDRMMAAAIHVTGDPGFGLTAGRSLALMKYGAITPLVISSPTLRQMLIDVARFAPLVIERSEIELDDSAEVPRLVVNPVVRHDGVSHHFRTDLILTSAFQMLRISGAEARDIHHVDLPFQVTPDIEQRYAMSFRVPLRFGAKECAISFKPALLDAPLPFHDPLANMTARTRIEAMLAGVRHAINVDTRVRQWLLDALPRVPSIEDTARQLDMSERSLRRQLSALNTSHAELQQECQRVKAADAGPPAHQAGSRRGGVRVGPELSPSVQALVRPDAAGLAPEPGPAAADRRRRQRA
jgi:hypothetical protein